MSIAFNPIDLSGFTTGQSGTIDLSKIMGGGGIATTPGAQLPTFRLHNDSGCGLAMTMPKSGQSFNLPAGGWQDCQPMPGESAIDFTVVYALPNPPVSSLLVTYFAPGEQVPAMTILGNSPIGGGVATNNAQFVSNTGFPPGNTVVFAEPAGDSSAEGATNINNQGQMTLGDSLYNGAATLLGTDLAQLQLTRNEILMLNAVGTLVLNILAASGIQLSHSFPIGVVDSTATFRKTLFADNLDEIILACSKANNILFQDNAGNGLATIDGNGFHLIAGTLNFLAGHISRIVYTNIPSVTSTAAFFNHNLGTTPDACIIVPNDGFVTNAQFSAYYEKSSMTSTQVKLQTNSVSGISVGLWAIKF